MSGYKHIETAVARFISLRYHSVVEAGPGSNLHAAELIQRAGLQIICIDLFIPPGILPVTYKICDISQPKCSFFSGIECIYSIRPGEEMIGPLILLARRIKSDLIVYHLGFELSHYPSRVVDAEIPLLQYVTRQS